MLRGLKLKPARGDHQVIRVAGGYQPDTVYGRAGEPLALIFRREETSSCSEQVVFPALGRSISLPPYEDVLVELPASQAGSYEFSCRMGMLHGTLIIEEGDR